MSRESGIALNVSAADTNWSDWDIATLRSWNDYEECKGTTDLLVLPDHEGSRYQAGFAVSRRCVERALRLRFEVFNLELGEGLESSAATGFDEDEFDKHMVHLVLLDRMSHEVVGTYRLQTMLQARRSSAGSYAGQEFDLGPLEPILYKSVECGRACLAQAHRNMRALTQLWLGIGAFMNLHRQKFLFGCCSLPTVNPSDGWAAMRFLREQGCLHEEFRLNVQERYHCGVEKDYPGDQKGFSLPKLFKIYLRLGAKVVSEPALDRAFGTIDFLVLLDTSKVQMSSLGVVHDEG